MVAFPNVGVMLLLLLHTAVTRHHGAQQDVFGLDVPVDDPQGVQVSHGVQTRRDDLARDGRLFQFSPGPLQRLVQVPAARVLLHEVDVVPVLERGEQVDDVRVAEPRVQADLARDLVPIQFGQSRLAVELERDARARRAAGRRVEQ